MDFYIVIKNYKVKFIIDNCRTLYSWVEIIFEQTYEKR